MELVLERAYFKEGTNGTLFCSYGLFNAPLGRFLCHTIELPWKDNKRTVSCIPEGIYEIVPRFSTKFSHHLLVKGVPDRSLILIHPANDALKELEGCIAPVTYLSGLGTGTQSKTALQKLLSLVHQAQERHEPISLTIKSVNHEYYRTLQTTDPKIL
ncbi:DUF5675 family protein [Geojedonia litorea]|uniref:DUF5675 family protein n=1 Tax=Geojedonia litorea TaxID=1268269 RepID=A0ABV9N1R6_9FLAO